MTGDEIVVKGANIARDKVKKVLCRHLGINEPETQKKGIPRRLFGQ
jgi:hypothetical protein